jgi:hypothetical protein
MTKIIIQELERDDSPITDIWATIEMDSEMNNGRVQFQLEKLLSDWDTAKVNGHFDYTIHFSRWFKMAEKNGYKFESDKNFIPKHLK